MNIEDIQNYFLSFFGSLETPETDIEKIREDLDVHRGEDK